ncbi:hypothetical protein PFICI_08503 [Pestalotiopsis fici W106-1]|uniref:galacturonan 1,4-alpha-galacturonidase n=1 Tax=Pestalotiopsis fici (strain W106-1 / CGMCC3.15140) TaxID=1229662 RepID=W3WXT6_PESFW|nr:uncharacterized protein PFICI_08503 [Pestalotiopsis fici W106-1]ETS78650.1 hypothetical protein PFICI_08503 [Pestalotiopsis fici W106-1]
MAAAAIATFTPKPLVYPPGGPSNMAEFREMYPYESYPIPLNRTVVTIRPSVDDQDDISQEFLEGLKKANFGGTVYLPAGYTYVIAQRLDLTFLEDVEVKLDGVLQFTNDIEFWQKPENLWQYPFQGSVSWWKWGGKNVKLYGQGTIDGQGQIWWDELNGQTYDEFPRPILFYATNLSNFRMEGILLKDSPDWTQLYVYSNNIEIENVLCDATSNNDSIHPSNTDFFDSINVDGVHVKNVWSNEGDVPDCFSPKTNSTNLHVDTMYCNGTHGQSMGSIGQYEGEVSIIENVLIENVWLFNGANGPRMKSWAGPQIGRGYINNVTYRNIWLANSDMGAQIDSCYFGINATECAQYPSQVNVTNILMHNVTGTLNGRYGREVAIFTCSTNPSAQCTNITLVDWEVE